MRAARRATSALLSMVIVRAARRATSALLPMVIVRAARRATSALLPMVIVRAARRATSALLPMVIMRAARRATSALLTEEGPRAAPLAWSPGRPTTWVEIAHSRKRSPPVRNDAPLRARDARGTLLALRAERVTPCKRAASRSLRMMV
ncbi:MAG: hypothetical protein AB7R00_02635 [Kofleriaceae bacterium]